MSDLFWIPAALADAAARGEATVLATVVRTEGSTYRRAGARMLVGADGRTLGAVSGGCLEADLALRAEDARATGAPVLVTYDTRAGEDLVWGLGLGCNGRVDVLLEPLAGGRLARAAAEYAHCAALDEAAVLVTVISVESGEDVAQGPQRLDTSPGVGDRVLVTADAAEAWDAAAAAGLAPELVADAREALRSGRSAVRRYATGLTAWEVLHEVLQPPVALLVCGAGPDAVPVARFAAALGWRVTVADDRPGFARPERFPDATVVRLDADAPATARWRGGPRAAAVVMAHHYERDRAHLAALLATDVAYVGVLGPRRRTERMLADLGAAPDAGARLHAPVGLDLGAETPEEIALAIVAEVAGVLRARPVTSLRDRAGAIHDPVPGPAPERVRTLAAR